MQPLKPILNGVTPDLISEPGAERLSPTRKAIALLIAGVCVMAPGCKASEVIWSAEARSSDGIWLATGRTLAQSGPGNDYIETDVYLGQANSSRPPTLILAISGGTEVPPGVTGVKMEWLAPTHLELTYAGGRTVSFQAVRCSGIDITVREFSSIDYSPGPSRLRRNSEIGRKLVNGK